MALLYQWHTSAAACVRFHCSYSNIAHVCRSEQLPVGRPDHSHATAVVKKAPSRQPPKASHSLACTFNKHKLFNTSCDSGGARVVPCWGLASGGANLRASGGRDLRAMAAQSCRACVSLHTQVDSAARLTTAAASIYTHTHKTHPAVRNLRVVDVVCARAAWRRCICVVGGVVRCGAVRCGLPAWCGSR